MRIIGGMITQMKMIGRKTMIMMVFLMIVMIILNIDREKVIMVGNPINSYVFSLYNYNCIIVDEYSWDNTECEDYNDT